MSGAAFQIELTAEPLPERTDLATLPFAVLLANARMQGVTGVLELRGEKRVFFSRGVPVRVESDIADETSELYLLRSGAVEASDLEPARELARSRGGRIGEALLGLGVLEANELFEHTRNQARDSLIGCFQWERGSVTWEPRERLSPEILQVPLEVARVFFDGILRFYDRRRLDRELPVDDASRLYVVQAPRIAIDASAIGTVEARILKLAGGRPALASAAMAVGLSSDDLRRRAYGLYCLGVVGFEVDVSLPDAASPRASAPLPSPPAGAAPTSSGHVARAGTAGHWPQVGTSPGFRAPAPAPSEGQRRSAIPPPPSRQSSLPPSRPSAPPPPPAASPSRSAFTPPPRPAQAAPTPGTPPPEAPQRRPEAASRPRTAPTPAPPKAAFGPHAVVRTGRPTKSVQAYLEDCELARAAKDWDAAYLALEYALELEPENPFIWGEKAYTMMLHDSRAFGKEANALARDARKSDASLPLPYVVLGMLMEQIRETERAIQMYKVALQKDPVCEAAQERLERIEAKR